MRQGDIILTAVPQADGQTKNRPALFLREMPPFGDALVCGISTQLHQEVSGFDEMIRRSDADFSTGGLVAESLIRLGFLALIPRQKIIGSIGTIATARHKRLLANLSEYLIK
jgi:mRNA interferase MazF